MAKGGHPSSLPRSGWATVVAWLLTLGCSAPTTPTSSSEQYLNDRAYRRRELEAALVTPSDGYAQVRLAHYATGTNSDWDNLPEWNPETELVSSELTVSGATSTPAGALEFTNIDDEASLLALGKLAFSRYPAQLAPYLAVAIGSPKAAAQYGLWMDNERGVGGLVRARVAVGTTVLALTCASCHAAPTPTGIQDGRANSALDLGAAIVAASGSALDPETAAHFGIRPVSPVTDEIGCRA